MAFFMVLLENGVIRRGHMENNLYLLFSLTQEDVLPTAQTLSLDFPDEPLLCGLHSKPHTVRAQNTLRSQWHFTYSFPKTDTNDKNREWALCVGLAQ